jgi:hypothetical protein
MATSGLASTMPDSASSSLVSPENSAADHPNADDGDDDFLVSAPSTSRVILEETEPPSSTTSTSIQSQSMMSPLQSKGFKNFLGTNIIKKFQKAGPSSSIDDISSHIGEIPKPIILRPVEPVPLPREQSSPIPGRKRHELIRTAFASETPSRRAQYRRTFSSKELGEISRNATSLLLSASRGAADRRSFQCFDDSDIMIHSIDLLQSIDDGPGEPLSPRKTITDTVEALSSMHQHQKSMTTSDLNVSLALSSIAEGNPPAPPAVPPLVEANNSGMEKLESLMRHPAQLPAGSSLAQPSLHDAFEIADDEGLEGVQSVAEDSFFG